MVGQEAFSVGLAEIQVRLRHIHSIEVWRETWIEEHLREGGRRDRVQRHKNTVNYVVPFEPGVTVPEGVQASITRRRTFWGKIKSFEWRAFPAFASRLKADEFMNSRLLGYLGKNLPEDLRIRRRYLDVQQVLCLA